MSETMSEQNKNLITQEEEKTFQEILKKKDLEILLEHKRMYKEHILSLYDMQKDIEKFQNNIQSKVDELQNVIVTKCKHEWVRCSDGGYDESPDYVCVFCDSYYHY